MNAQRCTIWFPGPHVPGKHEQTLECHPSRARLEMGLPIATDTWAIVDTQETLISLAIVLAIKK